jgi:hypothetical protein
MKRKNNFIFELFLKKCILNLNALGYDFRENCQDRREPVKEITMLCWKGVVNNIRNI